MNCSFLKVLFAVVLTVSDQHQGGLGLGFAVVDLDGVCALVGSGEMIHRHLDHSCCHVMTDLMALRHNNETLWLQKQQ